MPFRTIPFVNGEYYHIYNRGLQKEVFTETRSCSHFIQTLFYYQIQNPKPKFSLYRKSSLFNLDPSKRIVEIICYCLMPNHYHLLLKQNTHGGVSEFMRKISDSYTKYKNTKFNRRGPLFQGMFKAVLVESEEQLLHLSRYIHLNPIVSKLVKDLKLYPWSSDLTYLGLVNNPQIAKEEILQFFKSPADYQKFVMDQADYGTTLELLKHATIDEEC